MQRGDIAGRAVSCAAVLMGILGGMQRRIETQRPVSWGPGNECCVCAAVQHRLNPSVLTRCYDMTSLINFNMKKGTVHMLVKFI